MIRLHLNESPFPPSPRVGEYLARFYGHLNRYALKEFNDRLIELLHNYTRIDRKNISVFPSSSSALWHLTKLAIKSGFRVVSVRPTFHGYIEMLKNEDARFELVNLRYPDFTLDLDALLERVSKDVLVYISNPNNPTANILLESRSDVEELCKRSGLVVIDEAYFEFSNITFSNLIYTCDNLVVVRTLSKAFSLAGARIGYILAPEHIIAKLNEGRLVFDVPLPSIIAAVAALEDLDYMRMVVRAVVHLRERLAAQLASAGLKMTKSSTNFLLVELPRKGSEVGEALRERGILVHVPRDPMLENFIRVSVGREEENEAFVKELMNVLKESQTG